MTNNNDHRYRWNVPRWLLSAMSKQILQTLLILNYDSGNVIYSILESHYSRTVISDLKAFARLTTGCHSNRILNDSCKKATSKKNTFGLASPSIIQSRAFFVPISPSQKNKPRTFYIWGPVHTYLGHRNLNSVPCLGNLSVKTRSHRLRITQYGWPCMCKTCSDIELSYCVLRSELRKSERALKGFNWFVDLFEKIYFVLAIFLRPDMYIFMDSRQLKCYKNGPA